MQTVPADQSRPGDPVLSVVRGQPTDAEIAAVVAVLALRARQGAAAQAAARTVPAAARSGWSDRSRQLRQPFAAGPGAWRRSTLPR
jgi:hypothetical protein